MFKAKVHTNFWYISPLLAFSADNKYLSLGWLCFSIFVHFEK